MDTIRRHLRAMIELKKGAVVFDYGNNLQVKDKGYKRCFVFRICRRTIVHCFAEGRGPLRWVALSGEPEDIYRTDEIILHYSNKIKA